MINQGREVRKNIKRTGTVLHFTCPENNFPEKSGHSGALWQLHANRLLALPIRFLLLPTRFLLLPQGFLM